MINGAPANVVDYGSGSELGALLQAAINDGATYVEIPDATNWTWTTPVVLPSLWRGRIVSRQSKDNNHAIIAKTGHNNPCIDAQGALFVDLEGFNVVADDSTSTAPACFVVFARMPSGASSSNHRVVNNLIEGQWYYCGIYNCGGEELYFENNYVSIYGTSNAITYQTASIVHTLNEESYFSGIVTKASRANAVSTSAIKHVGDVVKNFNVGGSALYVGPNANDISFDLTYGYTAGDSYFLSLGGYFDGIRLGADRVETEKSSPIVYAPTENDSGLIELYRGAFRRGGPVNSAKSAVLINGTTSQQINIKIDGTVCWQTSFGGGTEDIYLVKSSRKTVCDISFLNGGLIGTLANTVVNIAQLQSSTIVMGKASNLTIGSEIGGNKYWFTYDFLTSDPSYKFSGGSSFTNGETNFSGGTAFFNAVYNNYSAQWSTSDSVNLTPHIYYYNPNGQVGSITTLGSSTAYATSSDYRLKENIEPMTGALDLIMAQRPVTYKWKVDGSAGKGFVAHWLQEDGAPECVIGEKDAVDSDGNPIYQAVDSSFLIATLVKAIQELKTEVDALKQAKL